MTAISERAWDGSASRYATAAEYAAASLINTNIGPARNWVKSKIHLPYKEPNGAINRHGVYAAAAALVGGRGGVAVSGALKRVAARKLLAVYRELGEDPPESLRRLAGSSFFACCESGRNTSAFS